MQPRLWPYALFCPVLLAVSIATFTATIAQTTPKTTPAQSTNSAAPDVQASDPDFQTLQTWQTRYACVSPATIDLKTTPSLSRLKFAAVLNACGDRLQAMQAAGSTVQPADLAALQQMQQRFAPELALARNRQTLLDAKVPVGNQTQIPAEEPAPLSPPPAQQPTLTTGALAKPAPSTSTANRPAGSNIGFSAGLPTRQQGRRKLPQTEAQVAQERILDSVDVDRAPVDREDYNPIFENDFLRVGNHPLSTFAIDVDTASYSNLRRFLGSGQLPPKDAVRIEELINYFSYDYPDPQDDRPFSVTTEVAQAPWNAKHKLVHIGIQGKRIETQALPSSNLVFLLDVSGSMDSPDKLPLLKSAFRLLVNELRPSDRVSIVVYAGAAGQILPPTPGSEKEKILAALDELQAGGSTAGGEGIQLAYKLAQRNFIKGGNNRVILATDGDFNVGLSSEAELVRLIEAKRKQNIFLTVLGFGTGNLQDAKMEQLADHGNGNYAYIDSLQEARKVLVKEMGATLLTIAKDVKIQVEFNPAQVQAYRLIGYENRLLADQDFNDDTKDAGDLGAGHSVTALYEIIPVGVEPDVKLPTIDPLRYQKVSGEATSTNANELLQVKLRYKNPTAETSQLITQPLVDSNTTLADTSEDFRFSAAVAAFGMILRESNYKGNATIATVLQLARPTVGADADGYRSEFLKLVESYDRLAAKKGDRRANQP